MSFNREKIVLWLFQGLFLMLGFFYFLSILTHGWETSIEMGFGEFSVGAGTLLLAFYTYRLANVEIEESRIERRRMRIYDQLKDFYSPLRAEIEVLFDENMPFIQKRSHFEHVMSKLQILSKYEFYASEILKDELRFYFSSYYQSKQGGDSDQKYSRKIDYLIDQIEREYRDLMEEYQRLASDRELGN